MWLCWRVVEGVLASRADGRGDSKTEAPSWTSYLNTSDACVCTGWPHRVQLEWVVKRMQPTHPASQPLTSPLIPPHLSFFSLETRRDFSSRYFSTTALPVKERHYRVNHCTAKVTELWCFASECKGQMWKLVDDQKNRAWRWSERGKENNNRCW